MTIYGNKNLIGTFHKIIEIEDDGFVFENRKYKWTDITKIKRYDSIFWSLFFYQGGTPRAYIYLKDNKCIKLPGKTIQKENDKSKRDFLTGATDAYKELIGILLKNTEHLRKT